MPAHKPHILQPLYVSVFSSFKSTVNRELYVLTQTKKLVGAFDLANVLAIFFKRLTQLKIPGADSMEWDIAF